MPIRSPSLVASIAFGALVLAPQHVLGAELFWYDALVNDHRIIHCDLGSCTPSDFATGVPNGLSGDLAIDPIEGFVYWPIGSIVYRKSLSGGSATDIFDLSSIPSSGIAGIAVDPVARHVYLATPNAGNRIHRVSIDAPSAPTAFVAFSETGCLCSPQGLALDLAGGFLYWSDANNGKIARKALDLTTPIEDVVTGLSAPHSLALDIANDRVYFSQVLTNRISYALLSSPTTVVDLVDPFSNALFAGSLELDPSAGTLGELYVADSGNGEILHCDLDAGCPSLALLDSGLSGPRGLALLLPPEVPALGWFGAVILLATLGTSACAGAARRSRRGRDGSSRRTTR